MLVLTRRVGETVVIDGDIRVTVLAVSGDKVRLGIAAPDSVCVDRQEVHERRTEFAGPRRRFEFSVNRSKKFPEETGSLPAGVQP